MGTNEKRITIEDIGVERHMGFRLKWSVDDTWADIIVWEIHGRCEDRPMFWSSDHSSNSITEEFREEFPRYLSGFIKWDGCAELDQGCPHWCGADSFRAHFSLLKYIYLRAPELMGRGKDGLDSPWTDIKISSCAAS